MHIFFFTVQLLNVIYVQTLNNMDNNQDHFNILRKIKSKPNSTQRELAKELGFSLGKLNYCVKALMDKGFIKINNFKQNPNKSVYMYILTPKGISAKSKTYGRFYEKKNN